MQERTQKQALSNDKPLMIQDIVVVAIKHKESITGEFGHPELFGGKKPPKETPDHTISRLYETIASFVKQAADKHSSNCDENQNLKPNHINNITRLATNEFFFYTKEPLSLSDFEKLQQQIVDLAKKQPENLHLVLGSFAVRTPEDDVMNVVPYIECGANPKINLIIKNFPSLIDPVYNVEDSKGELNELSNVNARIDTNLNCSIKINNQSHSFKYNNVFKCVTAGGKEFFFLY